MDLRGLKQSFDTFGNLRQRALSIISSPDWAGEDKEGVNDICSPVNYESG